MLRVLGVAVRAVAPGCGSAPGVGLASLIVGWLLSAVNPLSLFR